MDPRIQRQSLRNAVPGAADLSQDFEGQKREEEEEEEETIHQYDK